MSGSGRSCPTRLDLPDLLRPAQQRRGDVAVAGADAVFAARHLDAQAVVAAVGGAPRGLEAEQVLFIEFLGDARRRLGEARRGLHPLGAAAALAGDLAERLGI